MRLSSSAVLLPTIPTKLYGTCVAAWLAVGFDTQIPATTHSAVTLPIRTRVPRGVNLLIHVGMQTLDTAVRNPALGPVIR